MIRWGKVTGWPAYMIIINSLMQLSSKRTKPSLGEHRNYLVSYTLFSQNTVSWIQIAQKGEISIKTQKFSCKKCIWKCCLQNICHFVPTLVINTMHQWTALIARFMGPTWGRQDPGGPMLAPWTLLSGWSSLVEVMACYLSVPSYFLNQF